MFYAFNNCGLSECQSHHLKGIEPNLSYNMHIHVCFLFYLFLQCTVLLMKNKIKNKKLGLLFLNIIKAWQVDLSGQA